MDYDIPTLRIRALNDSVRRQAATHRDTVITPGIAELPLPDQAAILDRVLDFLTNLKCLVVSETVELQHFDNIAE